MTAVPDQASLLRLCLLGLWCVLPHQGSAQTSAELDRLLFEPELLAPDHNAPARDTSSPPTPLPRSTALRGANTLVDSANTVLPDYLLQPGTDPRLAAADIERYLGAIADEELDNGPFAPELLQQLLALGETWQQQGDHEEALEAFARAEHISRINNGLFAPEHIVIVENMIESHIATGDLREANTKQQYLLFLQQQYYGGDSMEVVPALAATGDWNMDAFNTVLNRPSPFKLNINVIPVSFGGRNVNPRVLAFGNLYAAQGLYYQAILNMVQHGEFGNPLLLDMERKLIETIFLGANRQGILEDPDFYMDSRASRTGSRIARKALNGDSLSFINGRNAWMRMRIYLENAPAADPLDVAGAIIGLGDWNMLFNRRLTALNHYREAWHYLQQQQLPAAAVENVLTPEIPMQLPLFTPLPHSRTQLGVDPATAVEYSGHIDVRFRISRFGNVRNLEILGKSANVTSPVERRLKRLLHSSPFRPRLNEGLPADNDTVALRYYFTTIPDSSG